MGLRRGADLMESYEECLKAEELVDGEEVKAEFSLNSGPDRDPVV
jgi:hypothetical protein